jgi:ribonuclease D
MTRLHNPNPEGMTISHEEINALPLRTFPGKIVLVQEQQKLVRIFDEVKEHDVIGFDTETRPSFKKGETHKVALMQIALPEKVFLIRLNYTGVNSHIIEFLENHRLEKAGVGIRDDLHALKKITSFEPAGFTELAALAKASGLQVESVKKLTALLLGFRISKSAQTSNWEAQTLTQKQIEYAATDAWVCLEIRKRLIELTR